MIDLAQFTGSGVDRKPPRVVVMGSQGIGKTYFAHMAPAPYFVFTEKGKGKLNVTHFHDKSRGADYTVKTLGEVLGVVEALIEQDHPHKTFVLDTLDGLQRPVFEGICKEHKVETIEKVLDGYGKGFRIAAERVQYLLDRLDALHSQRNMAVILLAHTEIKTVRLPDAEPFDHYQMRVVKRINDAVTEWADAVLYAHREKHVITADKKKGTHARAVSGDGTLLMHTEERPEVKGLKNRYGLPPTMKFDWNAFADLVSASYDEAESGSVDDEEET